MKERIFSIARRTYRAHCIEYSLICSAFSSLKHKLSYFSVNLYTSQVWKHLYLKFLILRSCSKGYEMPLCSSERVYLSALLINCLLSLSIGMKCYRLLAAFFSYKRDNWWQLRTQVIKRHGWIAKLLNLLEIINV